MNTRFETKTLQEIARHALDKLYDYNGVGIYGYDLHDKIFNIDYYIIGYYESEQWLIRNTGIFNAINIIQDYERDMFGEVYTDYSSSENVVNMIVYIIGEDVLNNSKILTELWESKLTESNIDDIANELEEVFFSS
jgi:hypothetical protein